MFFFVGILQFTQKISDVIVLNERRQLVSDIHHDINRFTMSIIMHREVEGLFR